MEEKNKQFPDELLDGVAGGGWGDSSIKYESGDTPRYHVGQTVCGYYIKAINKGKHGLIFKEFTYVVAYEYDHDKLCGTNVYESELMRMEGLLN